VLRRVDSASLSFRKKSFSKSRHVHLWAPGVRGGHVGLLTEQQLTNLFAWQETYPQSLMTMNGRTYWYFQDRFYSENDGLDADQVHALLVTRQQREQRRIDRAQAMVSMGLQPQDQDPRPPPRPCVLAARRRRRPQVGDGPDGPCTDPDHAEVSAHPARLRPIGAVLAVYVRQVRRTQTHSGPVSAICH
jgi:hypothetical protein